MIPPDLNSAMERLARTVSDYDLTMAVDCFTVFLAFIGLVFLLRHTITFSPIILTAIYVCIYPDISYDSTLPLLPINSVLRLGLGMQAVSLSWIHGPSLSVDFLVSASILWLGILHQLVEVNDESFEVLICSSMFLAIAGGMILGKWLQHLCCRQMHLSDVASILLWLIVGNCFFIDQTVVLCFSFITLKKLALWAGKSRVRLAISSILLFGLALGIYKIPSSLFLDFYKKVCSSFYEYACQNLPYREPLTKSYEVEELEELPLGYFKSFLSLFKNVKPATKIVKKMERREVILTCTTRLAEYFDVDIQPFDYGRPSTYFGRLSNLNELGIGKFCRMKCGPALIYAWRKLQEASLSQAATSYQTISHILQEAWKLVVRNINDALRAFLTGLSCVIAFLSKIPEGAVYIVRSTMSGIWTLFTGLHNSVANLLWHSWVTFKETTTWILDLSFGLLSNCVFSIVSATIRLCTYLVIVFSLCFIGWLVVALTYKRCATKEDVPEVGWARDLYSFGGVIDTLLKKGYPLLRSFLIKVCKVCVHLPLPDLTIPFVGTVPENFAKPAVVVIIILLSMTGIFTGFLPSCVMTYGTSLLCIVLAQLVVAQQGEIEHKQELFQYWKGCAIHRNDRILNLVEEVLELKNKATASASTKEQDDNQLRYQSIEIQGLKDQIHQTKPAPPPRRTLMAYNSLQVDPKMMEHYAKVSQLQIGKQEAEDRAAKSELMVKEKDEELDNLKGKLSQMNSQTDTRTIHQVQTEAPQAQEVTAPTAMKDPETQYNALHSAFINIRTEKEKVQSENGQLKIIAGNLTSGQMRASSKVNMKTPRGIRQSRKTTICKGEASQVTRRSMIKMRSLKIKNISIGVSSRTLSNSGTPTRGYVPLNILQFIDDRCPRQATQISPPDNDDSNAPGGNNDAQDNGSEGKPQYTAQPLPPPPAGDHGGNSDSGDRKDYGLVAKQGDGDEVRGAFSAAEPVKTIPRPGDGHQVRGASSAVVSVQTISRPGDGHQVRGASNTVPFVKTIPRPGDGHQVCGASSAAEPVKTIPRPGDGHQIRGVSSVIPFVKTIPRPGDGDQIRGASNTAASIKTIPNPGDGSEIPGASNATSSVKPSDPLELDTSGLPDRPTIVSTLENVMHNGQRYDWVFRIRESPEYPNIYDLPLNKSQAANIRPIVEEFYDEHIIDPDLNDLDALIQDIRLVVKPIAKARGVKKKV